MKLKRKTLEELRRILREEYNLDLPNKDLAKFAYSLIGLFGLLEKIEFRHKFGNRPDRGIDYK